MKTLTLVSLLLLGVVAYADSTTQRTSQIEPGASKVLSAMAETLAADSLSYQARDLMDVPLEDGHMVQLQGTYTVHLQRPDRLHMKGTWGGNTGTIWYSGGKLTIYDATEGTVATSRAPAELDAFLDWIATRHDVTFPGHDFLYTDVMKAVRDSADAGRLVGRESTQGGTSDHLQFEEGQILWELWVSTGAPATPSRLVMRDPMGPDVLHYEADFSDWSLKPVPEATFVPEVPATAKSISLEEMVAALEEVE